MVHIKINPAGGSKHEITSSWAWNGFSTLWKMSLFPSTGTAVVGDTTVGNVSVHTVGSSGPVSLPRGRQAVDQQVSTHLTLTLSMRKPTLLLKLLGCSQTSLASFTSPTM